MEERFASSSRRWEAMACGEPGPDEGPEGWGRARRSSGGDPCPEVERGEWEGSAWGEGVTDWCEKGLCVVAFSLGEEESNPLLLTLLLLVFPSDDINVPEPAG